jgi:hypothetical protein
MGYVVSVNLTIISYIFQVVKSTLSYNELILSALPASSLHDTFLVVFLCKEIQLSIPGSSQAINIILLAIVFHILECTKL